MQWCECKARVEKYEDSYQARILMTFINVMNVILKKVVSRKKYVSFNVIKGMVNIRLFHSEIVPRKKNIHVHQ